MLDDSKARQRALDILNSYIVQAPAGSGKTGLLTQRFLALLGNVLEPEECLAITFTKKAQAEMQERILDELIAAKNNIPVTEEYQRTSRNLANKALAQNDKRGWELLDNPKRLKIKTIDSLCASITGKMPVISRFGGQLQITQEAEDYFSLAIDRVLGDPKIADPYREALNIVLMHLDNNRQLVKRLFLDLLPVREQWLPYLLESQSISAREVLTLGLKQLAKDTLDELIKSIPSSVKNLVHVAQQAGSYLESTSSEDSFITLLAGYDTLPENDLEELQSWLGWAELLLTKDGSWRKTLTKKQGFPAASTFKNKEEKDFYKQHKQAMLAGLETLCEEFKFQENLTLMKCLPELEYTAKQWQIVQALTIVLPYLVAQLILVFKEKGQVDFSEVSIAARVALGSDDQPSDLALAMDYKLNHILVDEFQDTSIAQFRLLEQLTAGWGHNDNKTLFLVGDPMQSIYRFRQAEVGLFLRAEQNGVGEVKLTSLRLTTNFRADSYLVEWQNRIFTQSFPKEDNIALGAISFSAAVPVKSSDDSKAEFYIMDENNDLAEAREIVKLIAKLRQEYTGQSIAILVRAKRHLSQIITELKVNNISYQGVEIESLMDSYVVKDLLALTSAILHLGDRISWLSVLRAPWCGLTLNDLHTLFAKEHKVSVWQQLQDTSLNEKLTESGRKRLQFIIPVLEKALVDMGRKPLSILIQDTWKLLAGPRCLDYRYHAEDATVFFNLLQKYEDNRDIYKVGFFADKLKTLFAKPKNIDITAVQLMTIHKAKGLEFDHVILPGLGKKPMGQFERLLNWEQRVSVLGEPYLLLAPIKEVGKKEDKTYQFLKFTDKKKYKNELIRLFYVATTRAKHGLYGFGHVTKDKPQENSMLSLLWGKVYTEKLTISESKESTIVTSEIEGSNCGIKRLFLNDVVQLDKANKIILDEGDVDIKSAIESTLLDTKLDIKTELFRQVGILVHKIFYQIALTNKFSWNETLIQQWRQTLGDTGISGSELDMGMKIVRQAIQRTLDDPVGKWILDNNHKESKAEWELVTNYNGRLKKYIIDRTFIDEDGYRWIIDYKVCQQAEINQILPSYIGQLYNYKRIVKELRPKDEIKLGLYFPLQAHWHTLEETQLA